MKKPMYLWSLAGFLFTSAAGTLLHFLYDWSGQNPFFALFSGVNESIWEHMKLLFVSMCLFTFIQTPYWKDKPESFWCAKMIGMAAGLLWIPALYYTYTGALGVFFDSINISIFFFTAASVYLLELHVMKNRNTPSISSPGALPVFGFIGFLFILWTFRPPHLPLFQDPLTGGYGIP